MAEQDTTFGANAWLVDEMYEQYRTDPSSVSESWRDFFGDERDGEQPAKEPVQTATETAQEEKPAAKKPKEKTKAKPESESVAQDEGGEKETTEGGGTHGDVFAMEPAGAQEPERGGVRGERRGLELAALRRLLEPVEDVVQELRPARIELPAERRRQEEPAPRQHAVAVPPEAAAERVLAV